ncbi:universal stress protein [Litoribrevibacter albus]|uniref:Universal stress protein n=1 Tax=Litoribrevibacter albus TaxID=1473156 RepID=A0AA37S8G8_9GAMM|nr:universal stress protein [Litoribrevibacter albus]GLQ30078.1 universal stress protein [Litoribrevibacter albus]
MTNYSTILLAVDLSEESEKVIEPAKTFVNAFGSKIHVLHTIEPFAFAFGGDIPFDVVEIQDQLIEHAKENMRQLINKTGIEVVETDVVVGSVNAEVHRKAKEIDADLVIVGSHGRHGLALLLGSHASDVIHHAEYDVLAVRI